MALLSLRLVTGVAESCPDDLTGIVPGLFILEPYGKPVSSVEDMETVARNACGVFRLKVVDPKARRKRTVRVAL
jgi:hypothetical protein